MRERVMEILRSVSNISPEPPSQISGASRISSPRPYHSALNQVCDPFRDEAVTRFRKKNDSFSAHSKSIILEDGQFPVGKFGLLKLFDVFAYIRFAIFTVKMDTAMHPDTSE
jgi:hypothetical protein